ARKSSRWLPNLSIQRSRWPIAMVVWLVRKTLDTVRVLIVEDDQDTREMLALALTRYGATVRHAGTGAAAMHVLAEFAPHIVVCDLGLPDVSGLDWLMKLRAMPHVPATPAIALSGHAAATDRERSLAAGFEKHLNKPAHVQDIVVAIAVVVRRIGLHG